MTDDPLKQKILLEEAINMPVASWIAQKQASVLFAGTAGELLLPSCILYSNTYITWTQNGPPSATYNRSKSSRFNEAILEDSHSLAIFCHIGQKCPKSPYWGQHCKPRVSAGI